MSPLEPRNVAQWIAAYASNQTDKMPATTRRETLLLAAFELRRLADDPARSPSAFLRAVASLEPVKRATGDPR